MSRRGKSLLRVLCGAAVLIAVATRSSGLPIDFSPVTWGSGGDPLGWYSVDGIGTVDSPVNGGNLDGYLRMTFGADVPNPGWDILANASDGFIGDYSIYPGAGVGFDFLGSPSAASFILHSTLGDGTTWEYGFSPSGEGWERFWVPLVGPGGSMPAGWQQWLGNATFSEVLANVDYIGIGIASPDQFGREYGIDNWQAGTPEPGTFVSMSVLLLVAAARKRLKSLPQVLRRRADAS